jgi:hypothetical protein
VRRILLGKLDAVEKSGGHLTDLLTGERLTREKINLMSEERSVVVPGPSIEMHASIRGGDAVRFFCKIALSAGFKQFGEAFGRSATADQLREELRRPDQNLQLPGVFWPFVPAAKIQLLNLFKVRDSHVIAFLHDEQSAVFLSLFGGKYFAMVPLSEESPFAGSQDAKVLRLNLNTKEMLTSSLSEYILARPWQEPEIRETSEDEDDS